MKKKRIVAVILVMAMCFCMLTLTGCSKNIEQYEPSIIHRVNDYEAYYLDFEDGTMTVNHNFYKSDPVSPSGMKRDDATSKTYTFSYELEGDNYVYVDGDKYYYTIDKEGVHFSVDFLGIAKDW